MTSTGDWLPRSPDDSDEGWSDQDATETDELARRLRWLEQQRPPHASE